MLPVHPTDFKLTFIIFVDIVCFDESSTSWYRGMIDSHALLVSEALSSTFYAVLRPNYASFSISEPVVPASSSLDKRSDICHSLIPQN